MWWDGFFFSTLQGPPWREIVSFPPRKVSPATVVPHLVMCGPGQSGASWSSAGMEFSQLAQIQPEWQVTVSRNCRTFAGLFSPGLLRTRACGCSKPTPGLSTPCRSLGHLPPTLLPPPSAACITPRAPPGVEVSFFLVRARSWEWDVFDTAVP